jgi:hypothetical protein
MIRKLGFIFCLVTLLGASPASALGRSAYKHRTDWKTVYQEEGFDKTPSCVVNVTGTIRLKRNQIFDGKGCLYRWRGSGYPQKCHSSAELSENEPRMFEMAPGSQIRNLRMECSLDGILMHDDTVVSNVINQDCEEDCITTKGRNNTIINSKFYLCQDKCIQMNQATNVRIENNFFKHANRPMSGSGATRGGARPVYAMNNRCENCDIMVRAQSNHVIYASGNSLKRGECMFETHDRAIIHDRGRNRAEDADVNCSDGTRNVVP